MKPQSAKLPVALAALPAFSKGFSVFYFVLLPVFFSEGLITVRQLGFTGAAFITMIIVGALVVARWLHRIDTKLLLKIAAWLAILANFVLLLASTHSSIPTLLIAYLLMGLASGIAISGINVLIASNTPKGNRFKSMALLSVFTDIVRIVLPLLVAASVVLGESRAAIILILLSSFGFLALTHNLKGLDVASEEINELTSFKLSKNRLFRFILTLEFLDSFSSSQLFVFIPLLFLTKGYSLENTLLLQSFIFLGYMSGRWIVGLLASKYSGLKAIAAAEIGMFFTITLLLLISGIGYLYLLCFALGIFTRGTSPAIKALSFDSLEEGQIKRGSAVHVIVGDSGSAAAQLIFGLLIGWVGVNAPFIVAAGIGLLVAVLCLTKRSY